MQAGPSRSRPSASPHAAVTEEVQDLLNVGWLRVYRHDDLLGVELAGATKNVIALAAGLVDGLRAGDNAKSAVLARGLSELARLGTAMGAKVDVENAEPGARFTLTFASVP